MLRRKLFRDLWQNRTQFLSIFLMAFLGLFVFAGIDAESNGIGLSIVKAIMESHNKPYGVINHSNGVEFWFELDADV